LGDLAGGERSFEIVDTYFHDYFLSVELCF